MKSRSFLLRILNIYPNESWIVKRLYLFQFFQGAGLAFFFTGGLTLFLSRFPITKLPVVLIFSSLLLWIAGFCYTRLEHALSFRNFNAVVFAVITGSILILGIASFFLTQEWFFYLLVAWFNVLYLLNNLQFWGLATLFFDLRQSKRLFAVISAGDIPAKFVGYTLASIFVSYTGVEELLFVGVACMLASIPFLKAIIKSGEQKIVHHPDELHKQQQSRAQIGKLVKNFATNIFIRRIAFISLVTSACVILVNYGFYAGIKEEYKTDIDLAKFIAFFFAILRGTAFITKMLFTSRLTASIGIRSALFITPIGMLILTACIVTAGWISPDKKLIFYFFAVSSIIVDVLRTSFNSPVLLTMMQPLPTHERLRAHNIVKGFMDPFASLFCGVLLYTSFTLQERIDLMFLCYTLIVLGVLWLAGIILVNRQYLKMLIKTISTRYFSQEEFDLNDEAVVEHIQRKMTTGTGPEVISILRMLASKKSSVAEDLITQLLNHPSDQVKIEALRLVNNSYSGIKEKLQALLVSDVHPEVKIEIVKTFCKIYDDKKELIRYLEDHQKDIRTAAITGMIDNSDPAIREIAEKNISDLLVVPQEESKRTVISILDEVRDRYDHPGHVHLINDQDPAIQEAAIRAVGQACTHEVLRALIQQINRHEKRVLAALYEVGIPAIPYVKEEILSDNVSDTLKEKLIGLCGRIGGRAKQVLIELLEKQPQHTDAIIKALHRSKYSVNQATHKLFENIARMYIIYGVELLYMQQAFSQNAARYYVLNSSIQHEIQEIREIVLCLFECMYDREKINQAKFGLNGKHKESIANAMEIIEVTVKKDIAKNFNILFDEIPIERRCVALKSLFTEKHFNKIENILARILSEKPINYKNWTKACSLYFSKKFLHRLDAELYKKYTDSENGMLKETALFAAVSS